MLRKAIFLITVLALFASCAQAEMYDADLAERWITQFAQALDTLSARNDPNETADPSRAGQTLFEYEFGTVLFCKQGEWTANDILEIDVTTPQVTDCRGVRVGMGLADALGGAVMARADAPLYVLCTQEAGIGWSWVYGGEEGVYGVEHISYGESGAGMKEYMLTYVIDADRTISEIRMRISDATAAQVEAGFATVQEIAQRQNTEIILDKNDALPLVQADMQVMGAQTIGVQVYELIAAIGEPSQIQTLPESRGRILLYEGMVAELVFDEYTGVENVCGVTVSSAAVTGPRGLHVGMTMKAAASLFACRSSMTYAGGMLYLLGEAQGEPPYGEMISDGADEQTLRYVADMENGGIGILEIGIENDAVTYWRLFEGELEDGQDSNG